MKYKGTFWILIGILIKKPMEKRYGKDFTSCTLQKADAIYRNMLSEAEDIGYDNPMANNIYMGFAFMAIWQATDDSMDLQTYNKIIDEFMFHPLLPFHPLSDGEICQRAWYARGTQNML